MRRFPPVGGLQLEYIDSLLWQTHKSKVHPQSPHRQGIHDFFDICMASIVVKIRQSMRRIRYILKPLLHLPFLTDRTILYFIEMVTQLLYVPPNMATKQNCTAPFLFFF